MTTILCPECGTAHPVDATSCTQCGASLELEAQSPDELEEAWSEEAATEQSPELSLAATDATLISAEAGPRGRPGCVTAFALLMGIGAVLYATASIVGVIGLAGDEASCISAVLTLALAGLYIAVAVGLWRLKNWARIAIIVLQSLGMLVSIPLLFSGVTGVVGLVGLAIGGYSIYWFVAHGEYFSPT